MRAHCLTICTLALLASGCSLFHKSNEPKVQHHAIVTPDAPLTGKVVKVNANGQFVVLNFPVGHLPALGQRLNVYRAGLKTGEVKVSGPQFDDNVVADIAAGEAAVGDEVRDR